MRIISLLAILVSLSATSLYADTVTLGLNYPETGPYKTQGLDQLRAAQLAVDEINASGGILGNQVKLVTRDSKSQAKITPGNVKDLIEKEGAKMVFGGSASSVAIAAGKQCQTHDVPFFGTLTYSTATTGTEARRYVFRECYNAWPGAKVIADYLNKEYKGKKYLYITADYTWGHTTEASVRNFTGTTDTKQHKVMLTPFPGATDRDFKRAISFAKLVKPDVLVLVLFGHDMELAIREATAQGLKSKMQIVVPNLTLGMASGGGPKVMEGVVGALPWCWQIPYKYGFDRGKKFVEDFAARYKRYPSTSGASAYTIVYEYKAAVERAGSMAGPDVVRALENHEYTLLKDNQVWRAWDHSSVQTVYAVRCRSADAVRADKFGLDYFEIINELAGPKAFRTRDEWNAVRKAAGKPTTLELLPGETPGQMSSQGKKKKK